MEASSGATKLDFNNSLFRFPETLNGSGLNIMEGKFVLLLQLAFYIINRYHNHLFPLLVVVL